MLPYLLGYGIFYFFELQKDRQDHALAVR